MQIALDDSIPGITELFAKLGHVTPFNGRRLTSADLTHTDALIVRSITPVGPKLLDSTPVRFVATATSGIDHIDTACLAARNIRFTDAAGCNSQAVAEYVLTAILAHITRRKLPLENLTLGIVGCGRIGSRVANLARSLGLTILINDPPRAANGDLPDHTDIKHLLAAGDIVTLHIPLTTSGPFATASLVTADWLAQMKPGATLINTSRGEVIDEPALVSDLASRRIDAILDVWQHEPTIDPRLLELVDIATPHLAGYSRQAKRRASLLVATALANWSGQSEKTAEFPANFAGVTDMAPPLEPPGAAARPPADIPALSLHEALEKILPLVTIDATFRAAARENRLASRFDEIRAAHATRDEWAFAAPPAEENTPVALSPWLHRLGIRVNR